MSDRPGMARISSLALAEVARVHDRSDAKHGGAYSWRRKKIPVLEYLSAARRHEDAYLEGKQADPETRCHPLAHAIARLIILLDSELYGCLDDDRPPNGKET